MMKLAGIDRSLLMVLLVAPVVIQSMILTSVYGGRKKFKTIAFDFLPFLPPLAFEQPNKLQFSYRGHYTFRPPNINFKMNIPVSMPVSPFNGISFAEPQKSNYEPPAYDNYEAAGSSTDGGEQQPQADSEEEVVVPLEGTEPMLLSPPQPPQNLDGAPAYIRNGGHVQESQLQAAATDGYESSQGPPRPYTGKAQVSSFIDNGQFITASKDSNMGSMDAMFSDALDGDKTQDQGAGSDIRRATKSVQLGYETIQPPSPSYLTAHAAHPDSLPWGMGYGDLQKYYTTFQFTDGLRGQYVPYTKRKGLFGFNKLFPTLG